MLSPDAISRLIRERHFKVDDGLIVRQHASGNYIAPLLEQPLTRLTSFTEQLRERGFVPKSRWLRRHIGGALPDEMVALGLSPGARVARLERVRLADETPMAYEASALPAVFVPDPSRNKLIVLRLVQNRVGRLRIPIARLMQFMVGK